MLALSVYNKEIFDSLGSVKKVSELVDEKQICGVGQIILDHGYENDVNVSLAHRHFDLGENEVMLETTFNDQKVRSIAKPVDLEVISSCNAQPVLIACGKDNTWYPIGYGLDPLSPAWSDHAFLKKVADYLIKHNLQDKLLLATRNDKAEKKDGFQYIETNNGATRTSEVCLVEEKDLQNAVKTTFGFRHGPNGVVELYCNNWCGCKDC